MKLNSEEKVNKPTFLSLFSGCGGFDDGFKQVGFECKGAFDNDQAVVNTYKKNFSNPIFKHDLNDYNLPINLNNTKIDVVIAGSPCQGFSTAGLRKIDDPRNKLLVAGGEIAMQFSPKIFIAENVMGSFNELYNHYWTSLNNTLKKNSYNVKVITIKGTDVGLAQLRRRVFLIAWKGKSNANLKITSSTPKTLKDVISNLENLPNHNLSIPIKDVKTIELINHIKSGQKLCNVRSGISSVPTWDIPSVYGETSSEEKQVLEAIRKLRRQIRIRKNGDADPVLKLHIQDNLDFEVGEILSSLIKKGYVLQKGERYDLTNSFNGLYKRLEWEKPSMTVDTRFGNPRYFLHPDQMRGFTVREAARIQGFRDNFVFYGTVQQQFKMIGNAVPPPMARTIAEMVKNNILLE